MTWKDVLRKGQDVTEDPRIQVALSRAKDVADKTVYNPKTNETTVVNKPKAVLMDEGEEYDSKNEDSEYRKPPKVTPDDLGEREGLRNLFGRDKK